MEFLKLCWYALRRRWVVVLAIVALCLAGAALFSSTQAKSYTAESTMFLRAPDVKTSASAYQGDLFTRQRAQTYMNLFTSDDLAKSVIDKLQLHTTPADLESKVTAANIKDTVIIVVSATDSDAQEAANIANGYTSTFGRYVAEMENVADDPTVKPLVTVVKTASADTATPQGYSASVIYGAALALALALAALAVYLIERFDTRIRTRRQVEALSGAPVIGTFGDEIIDADIGHGWREDDTDLAESARRLLVGVHSRLEAVSPSRLVDTHGPVAVVGGSPGADGHQVATALATASAAAGNATCVIRVGGPPPEPGSAGGRGTSAGVTVPSDPALATVAVVPDEVVISLTDADINASRQLIDDLAMTTDLVVVDAPAAGESAACDIAIQAAASVVIVVSPGMTTRVALADAVAKASTLGRPVLGVVVTRAHPTPTLNGVYT